MKNLLRRLWLGLKSLFAPRVKGRCWNCGKTVPADRDECASCWELRQW